MIELQKQILNDLNNARVGYVQQSVCFILFWLFSPVSMVVGVIHALCMLYKALVHDPLHSRAKGYGDDYNYIVRRSVYGSQRKPRD